MAKSRKRLRCLTTLLKAPLSAQLTRLEKVGMSYDASSLETRLTGRDNVVKIYRETLTSNRHALACGVQAAYFQMDVVSRHTVDGPVPVARRSRGCW